MDRPLGLWRFMDSPRVWWWWFMDSPRCGGGSWIALGVVVVHGSPSGLWLFMDRPRFVAVHGTPLGFVAVHGSPLGVVAVFHG